MITQHFITAFLASILAALVTTAGIYTIKRFKSWGKKNVVYFSCFAAGVLISASFLYIVPKSFSMNKSASIYLLMGYLFMHFFNKFITAYVCNIPTRAEYSFGIIPLLGIGLHSFLDGIIYSITFTVSIFTGILATSGMVLHEFPEGIVIYLLLVKSGFSDKISFLLAFLTAALTTPIGMLVSFPFITQISQSLLGILLALSAGTLIYVGATHLLPHAEREPKRYSLIAFMLGIIVVMVIILTK